MSTVSLGAGWLILRLRLLALPARGVSFFPLDLTAQVVRFLRPIIKARPQGPTDLAQKIILMRETEAAQGS